MKPIVRLASAWTPDGGEMELFQHDRDYSIKIKGQELMNSRQHESELELARLGCAHLTGSKAPSILIGGLGLGYTLRQVLDMLSPHAKVVVGELLSAVVEWNREFLVELNGQLLEDERVDIQTGDIVEFISRSKSRFDAILLDIDNGPGALSNLRNRRLYGYEGIRACRQALYEQGFLAVWSVDPSKKFERLLMSGGFHVRRFRVPAYKGSKSQSRFVWVASENKAILPPGGGEPHLPLINESKESRRRRSRERY
ncbi:MAG: spermidine synthase [Planctomycetota bacterium]